MAKEETGIRQAIFKVEELGEKIKAKEAELEDLRREVQDYVRTAQSYLAGLEIGPTRRRRATTAPIVDSKAFRAWAAEKRYKVPSRGRITAKTPHVQEFLKLSK